MSTLTIREAKEHLAQCVATARALHGRLAALEQEAIVLDLRAGIGPRVNPIMVECMSPGRDLLTVGDYVAGMQGIIDWLNDIIEGLDAPDDRPFGEGARSDE
jgi:hypothetical protein